MRTKAVPCGFLTILLLGVALPVSSQVVDLKAEVGRMSWGSAAKKHSVVEYLLSCPWLEFGDGEIALRANSDAGREGAIDETEFAGRKSALLGTGLVVDDCVLDLKNDYVSLQMQNSFGFKTTLTATFFDRKQKPPVVALAYQTETPIGPDDFSYLFCECDDRLQNWSDRSDVLDEGPLDVLFEDVESWQVAWECVLPQEGGDVEFLPHASTAMAGDPYKYNDLAEQLRSAAPGSVVYRWDYTRGGFKHL